MTMPAVLGSVVAVLCVVAVLATSGGVLAYDNPCNAQKETYYPKFSPKDVSGEFSITPYFSPKSTPTLVKMVQEAEKVINIANPSWKSWIHCDDSYEAGCTPSVIRNESEDPFWVEVLNAIHRGVEVNVLGSYCGKHATKPGLIFTMPFLSLTGANVKTYRSTTFMHAKFMSVDGKKATISSINLSDSSMTKDREAGMVFSGEEASPIVEFLNDVFEYDMGVAADWPITYTYNASDMAIIKDTSPIPVPPYPSAPDCGTPVPSDPSPITGDMDTTILTMPDYAFDYVTKALNDTSQSLEFYLYVVNSWDWCHILHDLAESGVDVKILLSSSLVGSFPVAEECYKWLYDQGVTLRLTIPHCFDFAHQKYWIVDGEELYLSTGNADDYDYPAGDAFPNINDYDGVQAYRGFTARVKNDDVVKVYHDLFESDYTNGFDYYPSWNFNN